MNKCKACRVNEIKQITKYGPLCNGCYIDFVQPKKICSQCEELKPLKTTKPKNLCNECYKKLNPQNNKRPLKICYKCGELKKSAKNTTKGPLCLKCYKKQRTPLIAKCSKCEKYVEIKRKKDMVCSQCYEPPKRKCPNCNNIRIMKTKKLCVDCYEYPKHICLKCGRKRKSALKINDQHLCKYCYDVEIYLKKEKNRIKQLLRKRLRDVLNGSKLSKQYGIDFEKIIEHLGPCPGKREEYHIDHIFPLSAFDFNNQEEVKLAFAPENHQWLRKIDNLRKGTKHKEEDLNDYRTKNLY